MRESEKEQSLADLPDGQVFERHTAHVQCGAGWHDVTIGVAQYRTRTRNADGGVETDTMLYPAFIDRDGCAHGARGADMLRRSGLPSCETVIRRVRILLMAAGNAYGSRVVDPEVPENEAENYDNMIHGSQLPSAFVDLTDRLRRVACHLRSERAEPAPDNRSVHLRLLETFAARNCAEIQDWTATTVGALREAERENDRRGYRALPLEGDDRRIVLMADDVVLVWREPGEPWRQVNVERMIAHRRQVKLGMVGSYHEGRCLVCAKHAQKVWQRPAQHAGSADHAKYVAARLVRFVDVLNRLGK